MSTNAVFEFLRPFLWLAAIAFLTGFVSYLAIGGGATAFAQSHHRASPEMVSAPTSDDWNLPKRI
jgi:hypothetical protein